MKDHWSWTKERCLQTRVIYVPYIEKVFSDILVFRVNYA